MQDKISKIFCIFFEEVQLMRVVVVPSNYLLPTVKIVLCKESMKKSPRAS
jgi:hypothetical protein